MGVTTFGGPDALRPLVLPEPVPGPGEVRIRVVAAAVNPADTGIVAGFVPDGVEPREAWVPGMDVSGYVDALGDPLDGEAAPFGVGDPVVAMVIPFLAPVGGYAEKVVVPWRSAAAAPTSVPLVHAAGLPMNGLTARRSLDLLALPEGAWLAVTGAAGCYGGYVVELAKAEGLRVVADAAPHDRELVAALGADHVVARGDAFAQQVREVVPAGVDGLADGAVLGAAVLPAVRDGGRVTSVRGWRGEQERRIEVLPTWVAKYRAEHRLLHALCDQVDSGQLTLRVADVLPARHAAQAHLRLHAGGVRGRLLLSFEQEA